MGLDDWEEGRCQPVNEERLLREVRKRLGPQVRNLLSPPLPPVTEGPINPFAEEARIGVPVAPFPEWLRCPVCQLLAPIGSGLFQLKDNPYRPDLVRYAHATCSRARGKPPTAVPARFLVACHNGHLDEFPWRFFVHTGPTQCSGQLKFYEVGASLETANLWVECLQCGKKRTMVEAFGKKGTDQLPRCRGRHPHLGSYSEACSEGLHAILLGASNSWFAETLSVLSVPTHEGHLQQLVDDNWQPMLVTVTSIEVLRAFRQARQLPMFVGFEDQEVWDAIQTKRSAGGRDSAGDEDDIDLKGPEWAVFSDPDPALRSDDFELERVAPPEEFAAVIDSVVLGHRLREVSALTGFTRLQPPGELDSAGRRLRRAPLVHTRRAEWVPATAVKGEGIFLRFQRQAVEQWLDRPDVQARTRILREGHREWRAARRAVQPDADFPGALYIMLHSLAHAFMSELALECGYTPASIRERIYASPDADEPMAGMLVYTAAPDSEGTLGGLVRLGRPDELGRLLRQALERAQLCASDPLCSEHEPAKDVSLHGAACHACMFAPETSCEVANRYLDRALLVPTFRTERAAFFPR
jgi:hypothetical protein